VSLPQSSLQWRLLEDTSGAKTIRQSSIEDFSIPCALVYDILQLLFGTEQLHVFQETLV
jgi:hypothetical protein